MFHAEGGEKEFSKHRELLPVSSEATGSVCFSWKNSSGGPGQGVEWEAGVRKG